MAALPGEGALGVGVPSQDCTALGALGAAAAAVLLRLLLPAARRLRCRLTLMYSITFLRITDLVNTSREVPSPAVI